MMFVFGREDFRKKKIWRIPVNLLFSKICLANIAVILYSISRLKIGPATVHV